MDQYLKCNNLKCRQPLTYTSKAYIFCLKCAQNAFSRSSTCPACETQLVEKEDVVMVNLNPSESFKSSILAGFNPETIVEVCSKGLAFWNYQQSQEVYYQELLCQNLKDKRDVLSQKIKQVIHSANDEITCIF
ncbi:hypothetical protein CONCODRAFT_39287 [Conidiobolus coronatus NRRL 28638]|uniref:RING-type domain-containing protein n=1 Tax=Conidiobolus coronatus (strain ATCC 28846 / CBS 209.66 / NRRL 28638) TaxID=796925 RepID=A0A137P699_CONC2|nr:hypothetical protein CONCODRAFT_39287 [Conidiobolus coronatus NRRL 28638]|eukprot:KXN70540.1 hypothetical protein CONCODRAFT_39287 [Conidiobolus coronatus NRRL 28638]